MDKLCQLAHAIGRSDRAYPKLSREELDTTLNLGVVQRECRKSQVSLLTRPTDVVWLQKQIFEKRGWSETKANAQQPAGGHGDGDQFVVEKILAARITPTGVQEFLVQWASSNECNWHSSSGLSWRSSRRSRCGSPCHHHRHSQQW